MNIETKTTILTHGSKIKGEMDFGEDTIIYSQIEGTINIKEDKYLTFEQGAHFKGHLFCGNVDIYGSIEGSIYATGSVIVRSSAKITGQIKSKQLIVHPGSELNMEAHCE